MMKKWSKTACLLLSICLFACNQTKIDHSFALTPLSPYKYEFAKKDTLGEETKNRIDYYFTEQKQKPASVLANALLRSIKKMQTNENLYRLHSVYVYRKTVVLNADFKGHRTDLSGIHDNDLSAYLRWTGGEQDIFWLVENGKVVYDGLAKKPVEHPFEFD